LFFFFFLKKKNSLLQVTIDSNNFLVLESLTGNIAFLRMKDGGDPLHRVENANGLFNQSDRSDLKLSGLVSGSGFESHCAANIALAFSNSLS